MTAERLHRPGVVSQSRQQQWLEVGPEQAVLHGMHRLHVSVQYL